MTIKEIQKLLDADILFGEELLDLDTTFAFSADMMSDVLAFAEQSSGCKDCRDVGYCLCYLCTWQNAG